MTKTDKERYDKIIDSFHASEDITREDIFKLIDIIAMQEMEIGLLKSQTERLNSISSYYESKYNELLTDKRGQSEKSGS